MLAIIKPVDYAICVASEDCMPSVEVFIPTKILLKRFIIPSLDLVDREDLVNWAYSFIPLEEVSENLIKLGHTRSICLQTLLNWEFLLGTRVKTGRRAEPKAVYSPDEIRQLEDLYRAKHLIGMPLCQYEELILKKGSNLKSFLGFK